MNQFLIKIFPLLFICGCSTSSIITESNVSKMIPPGTISIKSNFYVDRTEITNIDWLEYMYWTSRVYGKNSVEYLSTLPDTLVWTRVDTCLKELSYNYFKHPGFNYHPLVGVSQEQAIQYSKWRSDRVFEQFLINQKMIMADTSARPETHFTIERYYGGALNTYISKELQAYYPFYRLPRIEEVRMAMNYADSTNKYHLDRCKSNSCKEKQKKYAFINSEAKTCEKNESSIVFYTPTNPTSINDYRKSNDDRLMQLRGNVSEWTNEKNVSFGGGWNDSLTAIIESDTQKTQSVNAWTGFRNVCEWKKWND